MLADPSTEALVRADLAEAVGDTARLSAAQSDLLTRVRDRLMQGDTTVTAMVSTILDQTVRMPIYRWDDAQSAVAKLARKAEKRGLPVPQISEVSRETVGEGEAAETWITARILGAAPVLNGWRCVATLTEGAEQTIVHVATGETFDDDAHAAARSMGCDHCHVNRRRNFVFVLRHEDGRMTRVGSTCLNDYLGCDALAAWFVWSKLSEITDRVGGWSTWYSDEYAQWLADHPEAVTRKAAPVVAPISAVDFLAACVAHVRVRGYVSSSDAWKRRFDDDAPRATGVSVWGAMQSAEHTAPTEVDHTRALEIIDWIDTLDRHDFDARGELRFTASLAQTLDGARKHNLNNRYYANTLAAAVPAYERELASRKTDAEWTNEHLPEALDTAVVLDLVVRRSIGWAFACADAEGRQVLVCKHTYKSGGDIAVGDEIRVSGSIGGRNEYRGVKQTFISRPSVYSRDEKLSPAIRKKAAAMYTARGEQVPEWAQVKGKKG